MFINKQNQAISLFEYLQNPNQSQQNLESIAKDQKRDVKNEISQLESGVLKGNIDDVLKQIDSGQFSVSLKTIGNHVGFNLRNIERELSDMAKRNDVDLPVELKFKDDKWQVNDDSKQGQKLQRYLDKHTQLQDTLTQTNKLSQFYEWGTTKQQASEFKQQGIDDEQLVGYLKETRETTMGLQSYEITREGGYLHTEGLAKAFIAKYKKQFNLEDE